MNVPTKYSTTHYSTISSGSRNSCENAGVNAPLDLLFGLAAKRNESDMWYLPPICEKKIFLITTPSNVTLSL